MAAVSREWVENGRLRPVTDTRVIARWGSHLSEHDRERDCVCDNELVAPDGSGTGTRACDNHFWPYSSYKGVPPRGEASWTNHGAGIGDGTRPDF